MSEMSIEASVERPQTQGAHGTKLPVLGETTGLSPSRHPCMTTAPRPGQWRSRGELAVVGL